MSNRVVEKASKVARFKAYTITTGGAAQKAIKSDTPSPHRLSIVITNDDAAEVMYVGFDNTVSATHKTYVLPAVTGFVEIALEDADGTEVWVNAPTTAHAYTVTEFQE